MNLLRASDRTRRLALAVAVGAVVASVGVWAQNDALVGVNYDDAIYVSLAKSIAEGDGYRLTYTPTDVPGIKYPPVYPFSLVPFWKLAGSPDAAFGAMKLANGIYIGVAAGIFVILLVQLGILSAPLAAAVALVSFLSGSMMLITVGVLSEPLYLILLFATLLVADRTREGSSDRRLIAVALLAGLTVLTRMIGITLALAVLTGLKWNCGRRGALVASAALALVVGSWLVFTITAAQQIPEPLVPRYGSYVQLYLSGVAGSPAVALDVAATNVGAILQTLGVKVVPRFGSTAQSLAGVVFLILAVLGARKLFDTAPATVTYPLFYLLLISTWTFPPFRFVFTLFPLLLAFSVVGVLRLADWLGKAATGNRMRWVASRGAWVRYGVLAFAVLAGLDLGYREVRAVSRRVWDGAELVKSQVTWELIEWVEEHTAADDVVAYEFDPMLALYSGRTTIPNNYEPLHVWYRRAPEPVERLARLFREMGVDYVAVRSDVTVAVAPIDALMGAYPTALEVVHVTPGGIVIMRADTKAMAVTERQNSTGLGQTVLETGGDR